MDNLRYAIYVRKSTESKERQMLSIPEQLAECKKYQEQFNLNVVYIFQESKSAFKTGNRPEFDQMVSLIKKDQIDAILTWKPDRLCRNPKEGGELLQLLQNGVIREIRTPLGDIYTPTSDQIILLIHFGMANQYSRNISQNVKRALPYKVARGEYYRAAPLGYENFGEQRGHKNIRPHSFEAPIIKDLFELCSKGSYSLGYLASYIKDKGLKTKKGKDISKSHLHSILTNPIYYGYFYFKGELYKGIYDPLISHSTFEDVQKSLNKRSVQKITSWKHPYNGLLHCGDCGCAITTSMKKKFYKGTNRVAIYSYHHCTRRRGNCSQKPISTSKLEKLFMDLVTNISIDNEVWDLGMSLVKAKYKSQITVSNTQLEYFRDEYSKLSNRLDRLITMRADGELTAEEFKDKKNTLTEARSKVEERINDTKFSSITWLELTEEFLDTVYYAREVILGDDIEKKKTLIINLCYDLTLKDGNVVVTYRKPFDILLEPAYRTNWQG